MKTKIETTKAKLIKKYHTLCSKLNMSDEQKREILDSNYGVTSSKDLHVDELQHLCKALEENTTQPSREAERMNNQRKKLLALIYEFCKARDYECNKDIAKRIACNACGVRYLNQASEQKLIAAIQRFDRNVIDLAIDELVKTCVRKLND